MELRLWGCLYGIVMVADPLDDAEVSAECSVEAELGVVVVVLDGLAWVVFAKELSMESCGFVRRPRVGMVGVGAS
jgi:hypothetical protein